MKVVLLAGGKGTRIAEESQIRPKPLIEIGGMPILWHIMKEYSARGFNEFIILIDEMCQKQMELIQDFKEKKKFELTILDQHSEPWRVTVVDTGLHTMTGGRIKRVQKYIADEPFLMTYGDGVCDVEIDKLVAFHKSHGKIATLTSVVIEQQKGILQVNGDNAVQSFREKNTSDGSLINAGYMVLNPEIFEYLQDDNTIFERDPMERLASEGQLMSYMHKGFWQCMDTKREKDMLQKIWESGDVPWKKW